MGWHVKTRYYLLDKSIPQYERYRITYEFTSEDGEFIQKTWMFTIRRPRRWRFQGTDKPVRVVHVGDKLSRLL